ncbi:hypothetical protein [Haliangium sp.]|uniref:hypothetical protein n=1 Tax=Haliangium sp. TaxID=2663208 RepID=UPI003D097E98
MTSRPQTQPFLAALTGVLLCLISAPAAAQVLSLDHDNHADRVMTLSVGIEHAVVATLGYGQRVATVAERPVTAIVAATLPWATPDAGDWTADAGVVTTLVSLSSWRLGNDLRLRTRRSVGVISDILQFAVREKLYGGYFAGPGWLSLSITYDKSLLTHLTHSDEYRMNVYPGARDGWMGSTGGLFEGAIEGGWNVSENLALTARVGAHTTERGNNNALLPYLASLGGNYRF